MGERGKRKLSAEAGGERKRRKEQQRLGERSDENEANRKSKS